MGMIQELYLKLRGDGSEAQSAIEAVNEAFEHLGHAAHAMEGAFAFEKIKEGMMEMVDAASAADAAQRKYTGALSNTSEAANPQELFEFAEGLQKVSTFSARTTTESAAMMARFKMTQSQIEGMMPSIQDLAAFMGQDLVSASDSVGRAVATGGRALQSLGLGFTAAERKAFDLMSAQQRMDAIQSKISSSMGGYAQVMASTATGSATQLKNNMEGLSETMGRMLSSPAAGFFQSLSGVVTKLNAGFQSLSPAAQTALGYIASSVAGLGGAAAGLVTLAGGVGMVASALPAIVTGFRAMQVAGMAAWSNILLPMAVVAAGIAGATMIIGALKEAWDGNIGGMRDTLTDWGTRFMKVWQQVCDFATKAWQKTTDWISEKLILITSMIKGVDAETAGAQVRAAQSSGSGAAIAASLKAAFDSGKSMLGGIGSDIKTSFNAGTDVLKSVLKNMGVDLDKVFGSGGETIKKSLVGGGDEVAKKIKESIESLDIGASLKDLTSGKKPGSEVTDKVMGQGMAESAGGSEAASEFFANLKKAYDLSSEGVAAIVEAVGTDMGDIERVGSHLKGMSDKTVSALLEATGGSVDALTGLDDSMQSLSETAQQNIIAASGGNVEMMNQMADGMQAAQASTTTALTSINKYWSSVQGQAQQAQAGSGNNPLAQQAQGMAGSAGSLVGAAAQGASAGGPFGAMAAVAMQIMSQSKSFQTLMSGVSTMLGNLAQAFNPLFNALGPILVIIGGVVSSLGTLLRNIFTGLQPIFSLITAVLKPIGSIISSIFNSIGGVFKTVFAIIGPIINSMMPIVTMIGNLLSGLAPVLLAMGQAMSGVGPLMSILSGIFKALQPVFNIMNKVMMVVIDVIIDVMKAIATAFNAVIGFIQNVIKGIANILGPLKKPLDDFADSLNSSKIDLDAFDTTTQSVNSAVDATANTTFPDLSQSASSVTDANNAQSASQDDINNAPDGFKVTLDKFNSIMATGADNAQAFLQNSTQFGNLGNSDPNYINQVSGTSTVGAASTAVGAANNGGQLGYTPPVVNISVSTNDPTTVANKAISILQQTNVQTTGNPQGSGNPYAVPTTMSGLP